MKQASRTILAGPPTYRESLTPPPALVWKLTCGGKLLSEISFFPIAVDFWEVNHETPLNGVAVEFVNDLEMQEMIDELVQCSQVGLGRFYERRLE